MLRFFEYKPLQQFVNDPGNEHDNSSCINNVHHFQVKAGWPVWILFSKEVHNTNLIKKRRLSSFGEPSANYIILIIISVF